MEFFWYDYETGGRDPRRDRPVQFSGVRTNEALEIIGNPLNLICAPSLDYLPNPEACLVHGVSPQRQQRDGLSEAEFATEIYQELTRPNTCTVGYNAMRFDHEMTRFLFYRNLRDPYAWHWRDGNFRWDVIDLMRAAYALEYDAIKWAIDENGRPSFKLSALARANGLDYGRAHDAHDDVMMLLALARLVREKYPKLFDDYLKLRDKQIVTQRVKHSFLWFTSKMVSQGRYAALMSPLYRNEKKGLVIACDLAADPSFLRDLSVDELEKKIYSRSSDDSMRLYRLRTNAAPFVIAAPLPEGGMMPRNTRRILEKFGWEYDVVQRHETILTSDKALQARVRQAVEQHTWDDKDQDADYALYADFIPDTDKNLLGRLLRNDPQCEGVDYSAFKDDRIEELVFRYRARNYPGVLSTTEHRRWLSHCRKRHLTPDENGKTALDRFSAGIADKNPGDPEGKVVIDQLKAYEAELRDKLSVTELVAGPSADPAKEESSSQQKPVHVQRDEWRIGIGHIFTTGRNLAKDRIIHIGGTRFSAGNTPPERKHWILDPQRTITKRMWAKTGVSKRDCAGRDSWSVSEAEVASFFSGVDILFVFNADNQYAWFRDVVLPSVKNPPVLVDLLDMSRFFLPGGRPLFTEEILMERVPGAHSGYRLPHVLTGLRKVLDDILRVILRGSELNGIEGSHMVYALLQEAISAPDPPEDFHAVCEVATRAHELRWGTGLGVDNPDRPKPLDVRPWMVEELHAAFTASNPRGPRNESDSDEPLKKINIRAFEESMQRITRGIASFRDRPKQCEYAKICANAINEKGQYAVEAGTGIGKTIGYLLPSAEYVRLNPDRQIIIASSTKNLMDQIVTKDWEIVRSVTAYEDIRIAVLKGKSNYLCITGLVSMYKDRLYTDGTAADRLAWLYLFMLLRDNGGRWEGMPPGKLRRRLPALRALAMRVNALEVCLRDVCTLGWQCVYPRSQSLADKAHIVITNHHKLVLLDEEFLKRTDACIVDEADQFPKNTRGALTTELSKSDLEEYLSRLLGGQRRGYLKILRGQFDDSEKRKTGKDKVDYPELHRRIRTIEHACKEIRDKGHAIARVGSGSMTVRWNKLDADKRAALLDALDAFGEQCELIANEWENLLGSQRYDEDMVAEYSEGKQTIVRAEERRIRQYCDKAKRLAESAREVSEEFPSRDLVHIYEKDDRTWTVRRMLFNISRPLNELSDAYGSMIFTSATLFVDESIAFFSHELCGRPDRFEEDHTARIPPPFEFDKRVQGSITTEMPLYNYRQFKNTPSLRDTYQRELARAIVVLSVALYGRTLVLFTNRREMEGMYDKIAPWLEEYDIVPLLQQGSSSAQIEIFRRVEHSVLFGVDRFWVGVDFRGATLSQVIAPRVPVPALVRPLNEHRKDLMGRAYWHEFSEPKTRMRMKQGFGRLIRGEIDKGVFVVLDKRSQMVTCLDGVPAKLSDAPNIVNLAQKSLGFLGLTQEFKAREIDLRALNQRLRRL